MDCEQLGEVARATLAMLTSLPWFSRVLCLQVMDFLGSAAFSKAVQALDTKTGQLVCLKIVKV